MCLSSNMIDFQKERMEHIVKKEKELKQKEEKLLSMAECNDNLNKYKFLVNKITNDLAKTTNEINILSKYVNQVNTSINTSINNDVSKSNQLIHSNQNNTTIVSSEHETSIEKIEQEKQHFDISEHFENLNESTDFLDLPIDDKFITGLDN